MFKILSSMYVLMETQNLYCNFKIQVGVVSELSSEYYTISARSKIYVTKMMILSTDKKSIATTTLGE